MRKVIITPRESSYSVSAKFPESSLENALERSIRYAKDLKAPMSATVQSARVLARKIDADPDSVTASMMQTFLKYCQSLGFTLDAKPSKGDDESAQDKKELSPMERFLKSRGE